MRAHAAGGHPSRTPPAPPTTTCMPERPPITQDRRSSPRPDCLTSTVHARHSCIFDLCISTFAACSMRLCAATAMPSRAHLFLNPLACRQKRADKAQVSAGAASGCMGSAGVCVRSQSSGRALQARTFPVPHRELEGPGAFTIKRPCSKYQKGRERCPVIVL